MSKKPNGKHLNEHQRYEIISKLSRMNVPSKRALAREYIVSEGAIRKVWGNREAILERFALLFEEVKERTFRASIGRFTELEDMLYIWIDSMCRAKLPIPPSLAIAKAKKHCFQSFHSGIRFLGILAMVESIQSATWTAKDAPSRRGSTSQQE
jgi:hypothetical protein